MVTTVRNALRNTLNPLTKNKDCCLTLDDTHIMNHPFIGLSSEHFLFDQYKKSEFKKFSQISGLQIENLSNQEYGDILLGEYESNGNPTDGIKHLNYLLGESFEKEVKPKMSFSYFRKKAEPIAFSNHYEQLAPTSDAQHYLFKYFSHNYASEYFVTRNKMHGEHFSTGLSQYLNLGQLHPTEIVNSVAAYEQKNGSNKSTYWIKVELLWREYFYWLYFVHEKDFFRSKGLEGGTLSLSKIELSTYLDKTNSNPLVKAMNYQLMQEGTLSNRARQIYASFLVHCTDLDWRYGAWFFQIFLKDYDLYSNWGNWLYLSGWGTDSRGPRFFNIVKQMKNYDPHLSYLNKYNPGVKDPWKAIKND